MRVCEFSVHCETDVQVSSTGKRGNGMAFSQPDGDGAFSIGEEQGGR